MSQKVALITGINGMDGSHLADLLLSNGYEVHGTVRRHSHSTEALKNIKHLVDRDLIALHLADMTDQSSLQTLIKRIDPHEIYNLAAQSFVGSSWSIPRQTAEVNAIGVANLLEAARQFAHPKVRIYQASTSEMFGKQQSEFAHEATPFYPRSPYGIAKLYAHWMCINYRESYKMHVNCGILFNHESERRGIEFVTQKIATGVAQIQAGLIDHIELGNLDAKRDWGYAPEYVHAMWKMLQQDEPGDFVIGTGKAYSVEDFLWHALNYAGLLEKKHPNEYYKINEVFMRPAEVDFLRADATKAKNVLGWFPMIQFEDLVQIMVQNAIDNLEEKN